MLVLESLSRPSLRSVIEPPTSVTPWRPAHAAIACTDSPSSSVSAALWSTSGVPIAFHFSGRTTTSAPVAAARATSCSAFSMFAALSSRHVSWTQATRSVSDIRWQDSPAFGSCRGPTRARTRPPRPAQQGLPTALERPDDLSRRRRSLPRGARLEELRADRIEEHACTRPPGTQRGDARDTPNRRGTRRPLPTPHADDHLRPRALRVHGRPLRHRRDRQPRALEPHRARRPLRGRRRIFLPGLRRDRPA